ncbi:tyrosine-protein phosphatase [Novosphingobium sp. P6W]|uniref:tyrosine-protein phosphatase n=1 Tax=Novosphingobium sp. P6W TaxID=1609758 RepID=UPI0005C2D01A|nr:tyrosine-protein phosphatase [Novosphingobium sp. P6W]AXB79516.1 protein-tyrosine-phosphatase [Novosphingobium sp. P6W]KIS34265.1 protein tyrosine phosphatase [Novosphingobium sp. P6W]
MKKTTCNALIAAALVLGASPASARELAVLTRIDDKTVELTREDTAPVTVWISADTQLDKGDTRFAAASKDGKLTLPIPVTERRYVILEGKGAHRTVVAERVLPLQQGSNFRDIGGYVTKSGKTVKWDKAFRSGAMPLLTEADYKLLGQLGIGNIVDLRSLEEREVAPDLLDDRTGALFIANDYSMKPLMAQYGKGDGENVYKGMEKMLVPQFRSIFRRLIANEGAVVYHCSAGQDRTGMATGLLYDVLGVDRDTIVKDYHLSTALRRTEWEMPKVDPKDYPNNFIVQYYFKDGKDKPHKAEPLFTPTGASHLVQFFAYIDQQYGGSEGYLKQALGFTDQDIAKLRATMLD